MTEVDPASPDLRVLIGHSEYVQATESLESVQRRFVTIQVEFMGVLDGDKLLGVCARRDLALLLSARYGFSLYARRPVSEHLVENSMSVTVDHPLTKIFQEISSREERRFYDDVVLVDHAGKYLGMIFVHTLVRLQTHFLVNNVAELESKQGEINAKNLQMEEDLRTAKEVQLAMLASQARATGSAFRWHHYYQPAGGVSGDFLYVLPISQDTAGILICDVMGHGVRSALVTAMIRALLQELKSCAEQPGQFMTRLNRELMMILRHACSMLFVTAFYLIVNSRSQRLHLAQAGHPAPLLLRNQRAAVESLASGEDVEGPALGLLDEFEYTAGEIEFRERDVVVLFTDGVLELSRPAGEEFGPDPFIETTPRPP